MLAAGRRTVAAWVTALAAALMLPTPVLAEQFAITGAQVHTGGDAGVIERGTVWVRDGRIHRVGADDDVSVPEDVRRIDAAGRVLTSGVFDPYSHIGIEEVSLIEQTVDARYGGDRWGPGFDVRDAINPDSALIPVNRIEGVTRALVMPAASGASVFSGRGAIIHLGGEHDYLVRSPAAMHVQLGESGAAIAEGSRAAALMQVRELLQDASDFADNRRAWERRTRRDYVATRLDLEALQPLLRGEMPLIASVHRASDIRAVLRLAEAHRLRLIIHGGAEAWRVADAIADAGVPVILDPLNNLPSRFETLHATLENAARLHAAGVTIAFGSGGSHNARNVTQAAGIAVANGLPHEVALAAITSVPARILGVGDRIGRLQSGYEADLVLWDGDPLEVTSYPDQVFIAGREIDMRSRQTELRDRYLERLGLGGR